MSPDPAVEITREAHQAFLAKPGTLAQLAAEQGVGPVADPGELAADVLLPPADLEAWAAAIQSGGSCAELLEAARADERARIAAALDQMARFYDQPEIWPEDSEHPDSRAAHAMRLAYQTAARLVRTRGLPGDSESTNDDTRNES